MKTLTLLRHAKAASDGAAARDFDRPLAARGRTAARAMGREMRRLGLGFDQVLASPARRVEQTLIELAQGYGAAVATTFDESIYLAAPESLLGLVRATDDGTACLLLAGHNPGMAQLTQLLSADGDLRAQAAVKYPTGALAEIQFDIMRWRHVAEGGGTLVRFIRPRDLDAALASDD